MCYCIKCKDPSVTDIYIGHTKNKRVRKSQHKYDCTNELSKLCNKNLYIFICANGGWDNWVFEILHNYTTCSNLKDALKCEDEWINKLNATLNKNKAYISDELSNYQKCKDYIYKWRNANKEKIFIITS